MPGLLLYLVTAAALLGLCHRVLRPMSGTTALLLGLLPLAFTGPAHLSGEVYAPIDLSYRTEPLRSLGPDLGIGEPHNPALADVATQVVPWRQAVRSALGQGAWPHWNPFVLGGTVLAASAQAAPYHPLHLLELLLPLPGALTYAATATLFLAGLWAFLFARELGCREGAALVAAAGWAFSEYHAFWLLWSLGLAVGVLPLVLLGVRRLVRRPGEVPSGPLFAGLVLLLLAGHPETAFHVVVLGTAYAGWELSRSSSGPRLAAVGTGLGTGLAALLATAPFLLPVLDALPRTHLYWLRHEAFPALERSLGPAEVLSRLQTAVYPFAMGPPGREVAAAPPYFLPWASAGCGSLVLALAVLGLWRSRAPERWFLLAMGLFGTLVAVKTPGLYDLVLRLPLFDVAVNQRLVFAGGFATAIAAGLGAEAWAEAEIGHRPRAGPVVVAGVAILLAVGVVLLWPRWTSSGVPAGFLGPRIAWLLAPLPVLGLLLAARRRTRTVLVALLVLVVVQRTAERGGFYPSLPAAVLAPEIPILDGLPPSDPAPYRFAATGGILLPNSSVLYGLEDVRGYEATTLHRFVETFPLWAEDRSPWFNRIPDLEAPFLDLLGVRFALTPRRRPVPAGWRQRAVDGGLRLLESTEVFPRVFLPRTVELVPPAPGLPIAIAGARDFGERAWIESAVAAPPRPNGRGRVSVERSSADLLLSATLDDPAWIVITEPAWPGWRLRTAAGDDLPLVRADHVFLAAELPAGEHQLRLAYRPRFFVLGGWLALAAWILVGWRSLGSPGSRRAHR